MVGIGMVKLSYGSMVNKPVWNGYHLSELICSDGMDTIYTYRLVE